VVNLAVPIGSLTLSGPDATRFLEGQVTQRIASVPVGEATLGAVMFPEGHLLSPLRLVHTEDETWELMCPTPLMQTVAERLNRFFIRVKASLEATAQASLCAIEANHPTLEPLWPLNEQLSPTKDVADVDSFLRERLLRGSSYLPQDGAPRLQVESVPTLSDRAVSYTKGCYTGQELVARTHSRGAKPPLTLIALEGEATDLADQDILSGTGEVAGVITSSLVVAGRLYAIAQTKRRFVEEPTYSTASGSPLTHRAIPS